MSYKGNTRIAFSFRMLAERRNVIQLRRVRHRSSLSKHVIFITEIADTVANTRENRIFHGRRKPKELRCR